MGFIYDWVGRGTHASRPASPPIGSSDTAVFYETDTTNTFVWTGSAWVQINGGGGNNFLASGLSVPLASSFSFINGSGTGASASNATNGPMIIEIPGAGTFQVGMFAVAVPSSAPWTATAQLRAMMPNNGGQAFGMAVSDGTKWFAIFIGWDSNLAKVLVQIGANFTSASTVENTLQWTLSGDSTVFFRIYNDGTNLNWEVSADGYSWHTQFQQNATAYLTATQVGMFFINEGLGQNMEINVWGWEAVTGTGTPLVF